MQTHIEALHFLYLCDNIDNIDGRPVIDIGTGRPIKKQELHRVTIKGRTYCIYNTGEIEEL